MAKTKTTTKSKRTPVTATGKTGTAKKPSAEVHHAAAAHHAAAQHHHIAAAHELNEGNPAKAKKHAKAAAGHSRTANDLGDEIIVFYEVWET